VKKFMIIARAPRLEPEACRGLVYNILLNSDKRTTDSN
jgi:hypothetical protein